MTRKVRQFVGVFLWLVLVLLLFLFRDSHAQQSGPQQPAAATGQGALFTGKTSALDTTGVTVGRRRFDPGARTYWHSHPGGQLLLIQDGHALVQEQGKPLRNLAAGESIFTGPNVPHWHGATPTQPMTHLNVGFPGGATKWMDPVSDDQYSGKAK